MHEERVINKEIEKGCCSQRNLLDHHSHPIFLTWLSGILDERIPDKLWKVGRHVWPRTNGVNTLVFNLHLSVSK